MAMPEYFRDNSKAFSATINYAPCFCCPECGFCFQWATPIKAIETLEQHASNVTVAFKLPRHDGTNVEGKPCSLNAGKSYQINLALYRNGKAVQMMTSDKPIPIDWRQP